MKIHYYNKEKDSFYRNAGDWLVRYRETSIKESLFTGILVCDWRPEQHLIPGKNYTAYTNGVINGICLHIKYEE